VGESIFLGELRSNRARRRYEVETVQRSVLPPAAACNSRSSVARRLR
jgi:hypothetical protein